MKKKLELFISENLIQDKKRSKIFNFFTLERLSFDEDEYDESIIKYVNDNISENKFQKLLFNFIDKRKLKDSDVYNKVHIDRRLFSKIRSDANYHPSKDTVILLALALELNETEAVSLLESASYSLPKNNYFDLIIRFCFIEGIYNIKDVNELLSIYKCKLFNY